jgi:hypothetical protein
MSTFKTKLKQGLLERYNNGHLPAWFVTLMFSAFGLKEY